MKFTWLGHAGWRIEIGGHVLLIDPWLTGNPLFPAGRRAEAIAGATHILITHGHGDHAGDTESIAQETGATVLGIYDLMSWWEGTKGLKVIGFNKGGTVDLGGARISMVAATHSSSFAGSEGPVYAGAEVGYMIAGEGHTIYVSGDTDLMADMAWFGEYYRPDIAILNCGGHFTMDMKAAAWAARKWFAFKTVFPSHYRTFGLLAQSADELVANLPPGVRVVVTEPMETVTLPEADL
jgi:L-ascorbate metabolism protein UlaG (beta-lactamase superfamily)